VERAKTLATSGAKTLLLCYNRGLADHLKVVTEGHPNLHAMSFHQLCDWRIRVARTEHGRDLLNEAIKTYPGRDRFDVQLPLALALSTEVSDYRYDAIVVDEGQDFRDEFWFPLMCLLADENESTVYFFFDHNQAIYRPITKLPVEDDPFVLTTNCRNTTHIHHAAYHYYKGIPTEAPEIAGEPIVSLCAPSIRAQATRLHACITDLIMKEQVRPTDIAILVAAAGKAACYAEIKEKRLPQGFRWSIEAHRVLDSVLVDTVARFKGLESAIVFLWGLQELQPDIDRESLYVGFSRAKSRLYLVGTEQICRALLEYELGSQGSLTTVAPSSADPNL
jgi:superfamily I DNA/RNA helicase